MKRLRLNLPAELVYQSAMAVLLVLFLTVPMFLIGRRTLGEAVIALLYLAAVVWSSSRWGQLPGMCAAVTATLTFNFFFIPPFFTFADRSTGGLAGPDDLPGCGHPGRRTDAGCALEGAHQRARRQADVRAQPGPGRPAHATVRAPHPCPTPPADVLCLRWSRSRCRPRPAPSRRWSERLPASTIDKPPDRVVPIEAAPG